MFRDQEYGADTYSRAVTRIQEVRALRAAQFPEDAGPMKHPVRPQSYVEIRNFYTMTVYEKGAEVVRMQHTLLGEEKFQAGMRAVLPAPRRPGGDLRRFRAGDAGRLGRRPGAVQALVRRRRARRCSIARAAYADGQFTACTVKQSMNPPFHIPFAVEGRRARAGAVAQGARRQTFTFED